MTEDYDKDFARNGHLLVDWIDSYLKQVGSMPVLAPVQPGAVRQALPSSGPENAEAFEKIFEDFEQIILPANAHWNHPRFHAYFSVSASSQGILGELLSAAVNTNGMVWKSSAAFTELELVVVDWLRQWLGLPDSFFGLIYDTASTSTFHAMAAARDFADPESRTRGLSGNLTVYTSEQAHSSVEKAAIALGLGQENVRKIGVDSEFRMLPDALAAAIERDIAAGKKPCCVVPTVGTTSTTSIDSVASTVEVAARHDIWVHIDGAYGACAAILPELQDMLAGAEQAHSLVVNPHKWFFTPIDLSILYTNRPDVLRRAFSLVPEYLKTPEDREVVNLMDYGVPLGRRFRALKLWFVFRSFGRSGITAIIREHLRFARDMAEKLAMDGRFEIAAPVTLSLVCFRFQGTDEQNRELLQRINQSGEAFLSHTVLHGRFVLRLAYGNLRTTQEDVEIVFRRIQQEASLL